jgi:histidinol phosphatase-like PHP family hydrolase
MSLHRDVSAEFACRAIRACCRQAIGSDATAPEHFDFLRLGALTARRGWAATGHVVNTLHAWGEAASATRGYAVTTCERGSSAH